MKTLYKKRTFSNNELLNSLPNVNDRFESCTFNTHTFDYEFGSEFVSCIFN